MSRSADSERRSRRTQIPDTLSVILEGSNQPDVLHEVGAQNVVELVQLVVAYAHEEEGEDRLARILDAA